MGLSDARNSHRKPPPPDKRSPRGWNGLTKLQRELLEDGTILLYSRAKAEKVTLVFWTATLPTHYQDGSPITEPDHVKVLLNWAELVNRTMYEVTRLYERKGLPERYLYVVEPQEERWLNYGVFAPHLHAVLVNRWNPKKRNPHKDQGFGVSGYWEVTTEETDLIWERQITNILGKPVDCRSACNVDSVKGMKQLMFYLSKMKRIGSYMSKGSQYLGQIQKSRWGSRLPASWAGSDAVTRAEVRESVMTFEVGSGDLGQVMEYLQEQSALFEQQHDRPLFTHPHLVTTASDIGEMAVALCCRVFRLEDIPTAMSTLLELDLTKLSEQRKLKNQGD